MNLYIISNLDADINDNGPDNEDELTLRMFRAGLREQGRILTNSICRSINRPKTKELDTFNSNYNKLDT